MTDDGAERWGREASRFVDESIRALSAEQHVLAAAMRDRGAALDGRPLARARRPTIVQPAPHEAEELLRHSVEGLATRLPERSSRELLGRRRLRAIAGFVALNIGLLVMWPVNTLIFWIAAITLVYTATVIDRVVLFIRSLDDGSIDVVSDEEARAFPDDLLPTFTVLVPAYHEPEVIQHLLRAVGGIEYPPDKLDIKLLLEADDDSTIAAACAVELEIPVEVILVPAAEPRTKPKALNYGVQLAKNDIITIYDAEDVPEPLQLRRAAVVLARYGDDVACVQAQLSFSNVHQNIITKWFTLEYAVWFKLFLPGLVMTGAPVPLGGTSNHFRRSVLLELGAWDPFNVTEDADLGIRMHRQGYRTRVMESVTLEEANSDFVNWVKQRSRWYKGYLQTWLVNVRSPRQLLHDVGRNGSLRFNLFVGGTPLLALVNPLFWGLTIMWFVDKPPVIKSLFPAPVFYLGLLCWAFGNFTIAYLWIIACRLTKRLDLLAAALLVPFYWVMMAVAAVKALVQLLVSPSYWEKTTHGLHLHRSNPPPVAPEAVQSL